MTDLRKESEKSISLSKTVFKLSDLVNDESIERLLANKRNLASLGVIIGSQKNIIEFCPQNDYTVIIRIVSPNTEFMELEFKEKYKAILELKFNESQSVNGDSFNKGIAELIIDFFETHKDAKTFVFHCEAGASRSPAVARAYGIFMKSDEITELADKVGHPHNLVLDLLEKEIQRRENIKQSIKIFK